MMLAFLRHQVPDSVPPPLPPALVPVLVPVLVLVLVLVPVPVLVPVLVLVLVPLRLPTCQRLPLALPPRPPVVVAAAAAVSPTIDVVASSNRQGADGVQAPTASPLHGRRTTSSTSVHLSPERKGRRAAAAAGTLGACSPQFPRACVW